MVGDAMGSTVLVCCFWGWFTAQFLKIFYYKYKRGVWTLKAMVASGGMPSSHSAMCTATTTAVGLTEGFGSPLFAIAICFSCIVMYDAAGVRRHAGYQAEVLNKVVKEIMAGHPLQDRELKEVLGHTPIQVLCGGLLGVIIAVAGINHLGF
ncbi:unnamed protein product [Pedinophyceae sp. YPF-701]|nr:unnamed protein product [Pedinophyceae sp. YPF-701]